MARPKKPTTVQEDLVSTIKMVKDATAELTELSQELGLYDITGNPLVKDTPTVPLELPTEAVETIAEEINATVAETGETPSGIATELLNTTEELDTLLEAITEDNKHEELIPVVEDKMTLKDGWGNPIPTKLVVIQSMNYTDLVSQVMYSGYLGSELDRTFRILSTVPFRIRVLMPEDQYENFLSKESQVVFDETLTYNRVVVKSFDLYGFFRNVIKMGKEGGFIVPRDVVRRKPLMVACYTRAPIADTPESRVGVKKVVYSKAELESFNLASLLVCGSWYGLNSNSKSKLVKGILELQGS